MIGANDEYMHIPIGSITKVEEKYERYEKE
jgi:hypothetical protein